MNKIAAFFASLGLAWILVSIVVGIGTFIAWVEGIVMVFHASIVLGIVSLFFQVPYVAESVVYWITGYDIALHLAKFFGV